jgi:hypothetical protein
VEAGTVVADRFVVERIAGEGGMGRVLLAVDRASGDRVALKIVLRADADAITRFEREANALASLSHPRLVRHVEHGFSTSGALTGPWLAMEWLDGDVLSQRLVAGALSSADALTIARGVAEALAFLHSHGVVHRDIKPSNIFLEAGDPARVKVLDLGVARAVDKLEPALTGTGALVGTPGYLAPEQAQRGGQLDARADVFALGCVLFECLTGRAAFAGEHLVAVLAKILLDEPPRVSELRPDASPALDDLVARMLAKDPERRPRDGAAVLDALSSMKRAPATTLVTRRALTKGEQQYLSVIVATGRVRAGRSEATTLAAATFEDAATTALRAVVVKFGGSLERLDGDAIVVTIARRGEATDHAVRAARCALSLRALLPTGALSLATGRGVIEGRLPAGEVIDRAAKLLRAASSSEGVAIDDVTRGLLDARFEINASGALISERDTLDPVRTVLGRPSLFVGRGRELESLVGYFEDWVDEPRSGAMLVVAPAGMGKSRLVRELRGRLASREVPPTVLITRGDPLRMSSPFALAVHLIRDATAMVDADAPDERVRKLSARIEDCVPSEDRARVVEFLGELAGAPSIEPSALLRGARRTPSQMAEQIQAAIEDWLAAECERAPVLLVVEDLHWGDKASVKAFDAVLRRLREKPFVLVALARPEVAEAFPMLWRSASLQKVQLSALARRAGEQLVRAALPSASGDEVARLVERAGGNALHLEELIRAVASGLGDALPETVIAMVAARFDELESAARRALRAASILGRTFWGGAVAALLGDENAAASASEQATWLDALVEREVLSRSSTSRFAGQVEYAFHHALLRDAAYAMLTSADRVLGHRLAGDWLERAGEADFAVLAGHFEVGGEPERAAKLYLSAAQQALSRNELDEGLELAARGLACAPTGELRGRLLVAGAEAHKWRSEPIPSLAAADEALPLLSPGSAPWLEAVLDIASAVLRIGPRERAREVGDAVLAAPVVEGAEAVRAGCAARMATAMSFLGDFDRAHRLLDTVAHDIERLGAIDPAVEAHYAKARGMLAMFDGRYAEAYRLICRAVECFDAAGEARAACTERGNCTNLAVEAGAFAEAEPAQRDVIARAQRLKLPSVETMARSTLGLSLAARGELIEARHQEEVAIAMCELAGDRRVGGSARTYLAEVLLLSNEHDEAEKQAQHATLDLEVAPPLQARALAVLANVLRAKGDRAASLLVATRGMELLRSLGSLEEGESQVRLAYVEALFASERDDEARAEIAIAAAAVRARAETLGEWTACFLAVAHNARILELSR